MDEERLKRFAELLLQKNEQLNLTGARTYEDLDSRHIQDSLQLLLLPEVNKAQTLLDLGTGGGLPGIPLAIACPDLKVSMVDGTQKKISAVKAFIESLELGNASATAGRLEDLARLAEWRQKFDVVVARALAPLPILLEYALPFCRPGGRVVAFKGPNADLELEESRAALRFLNGRLLRRVPYNLGDRDLCLLVFEMVGRVPGKYPRANTMIKRRPLAFS